MSNADSPDRRYLITPEELRERRASVTLIDLRPAEDFAVGHIEGSTHVDIYGVSLRLGAVIERVGNQLPTLRNCGVPPLPQWQFDHGLTAED